MSQKLHWHIHFSTGVRNEEQLLAINTKLWERPVPLGKIPLQGTKWFIADLLLSSPVHGPAQFELKASSNDTFFSSSLKYSLGSEIGSSLLFQIYHCFYNREGLNICIQQFDLQFYKLWSDFNLQGLTGKHTPRGIILWHWMGATILYFCMALLVGAWFWGEINK